MVCWYGVKLNRCLYSGVGLLVFTVISQLVLITRNIHFLILFPPHPSDPIRMQLYPALDDEGLIDGNITLI
ncbi:hypothetical protein Pmani_002279 [Petrolisthes manimaculis]|uniref:Uncharacterized protein n=1 Tax=Petrolisthes manimaculis TaxID=1843537 RepID=A0AAE1QL94_9EUCA|nr:hypothetical protein Pmani_002279 [Petrolisthes manimaculis]